MLKRNELYVLIMASLMVLSLMVNNLNTFVKRHEIKYVDSIVIEKTKNIPVTIKPPVVLPVSKFSLKKATKRSFKTKKDLAYNWCQKYAKKKVSKDMLTYIVDHAMEYPRWKLLLSIMATESNFDPDARSHCNALGLMQVNYPVWKDYFKLKSEAHIFDIEENIKHGREIFNMYYEKTKDIKLALNRYAGESKNGAYQQRVMKKYDELNNYLNKKLN